LVPFEASIATSDSNLAEPGTEQGRERLQSAVRRWLGRLNERERRIIVCRYGLGGVPEQTLTQLGQHLGISKQRVRQIEQCAHVKLRKWARLEGIESSEF
jgi:RNA polymerase primary sigma factor